jgi:hypothetical protein
MATPMKPPIAAETADTQCDPPKLWATQAPIPARSAPRRAGKNLFMTTSTDRVFGYAVLAMKFGFRFDNNASFLRQSPAVLELWV